MTSLDLGQLNALDSERAVAEFLSCCGSNRWAKTMADARPFSSHEHLHETAGTIWWQLDEEDWREAFAAHPRLGESKPNSAGATQGGADRSQAWSKTEQRATQDAPKEVLQRLADGNRAYEARFDMVYLVCATGKSAAEMLESLETRLTHSLDDEMRIAAAEQAKITQLRLNKLLQPATTPDRSTTETRP